MALQGTIRDFGPGEILQLIGIQRKTGVLTLDNGSESVTIRFLDGKVVGADTKSRSMEDLLGSVLVRTGRITEAQLAQTLRIQRKTLQRLGHILVRRGLISVDDLVDALRVQSLQIIYRLFRWRSGTYHFRTAERVDYDEQHFMPISAETILMEGARMVDEWPIIERRVKSERTVYRRGDAARALQLTVDSIVDRDIDADFGFSEHLPAEPPELRLSREEREVLSLVDGKRSVAQIVERSSLGEFDTYRILAELITRTLIVDDGKQARSTVPLGRGRWANALMRWALHGIVFALVLGAALSLRDNPFTPWRLIGEGEALDRLRHYASLGRLERIERAIQVFYLDAGSFPQALELLAINGYLEAPELRDPWNREYGYALSPGGYRLFGLDRSAQVDPDLTIFHPFRGLQGMMANREAAEDGAPTPGD